MMCGSMGCGPMKRLAKLLASGLREDQDLTIVCGTNGRLRKSLLQKYSGQANLHIMGYVEDMSILMDSADLYLTKPGGISVTEAAAKKRPMVFVNAVAGCEVHNRRYYLERGCAKTCDSVRELSALCLSLLADEAGRNQMEQNLSNLPDHNAAQTIYHYLKTKWSKNL